MILIYLIILANLGTLGLGFMRYFTNE